MKYNYIYRLLAFYLFWFLSAPLYSQAYYKESGFGGKYYYAAYYGTGTNNWQSKTENHTIYDSYGIGVNSGDYDMKTQSYSQSFGMETLFPVTNHFSTGIGIAFEENYIEGIDISEHTHSYHYQYFERFRFDKVYALAEFPTNLLKHRDFGLSFNWRGGYYAFSYLKSDNLFGVTKSGRSLFSGIGVSFQYDLGYRLVIFANPYFEYKYFQNTPKESPTEINNNLFLYSLNLGVRYLCF